MKLWLLEPIDPNDRDGPWWPLYNCAFGFVVIAPDEQTARQLAEGRAGNEKDHWGEERGRGVWTDRTLATCVELIADGEPRIVLDNYHEG